MAWSDALACEVGRPKGININAIGPTVFRFRLVGK